MDLSTLSNDQLTALYQQQASPLASMSDDQLKAAYAASTKPQMGNAFSDIVPEIKNAASENIDAIKNMYGGTADNGVIQSQLDVGKGLLAIPALAASPITGALRSLIGHPLASTEHAIGSVIAPEIAAKDNPQEMYATAKGDVDTALAGLAPRGASPVGIKTGPAPTPTLAETKTAATEVYNNPAVRATPVAKPQLDSAAAKADADLRKGYFHPADEKPVFDVIDEVKNAGPWTTVNQLDDWSGRLGKLAKQTQMGQNGPEPTSTAAAAMKAKAHIDDLMAKVAPGWDTADANYSAFKSAQGLDKRAIKAQIRAEGGNGDFAARLKTSATQMLTNPRATRGLTASELEQLRTISKGTATQNTLSWFGDLLGNRLKHGVGTMIGGGTGTVSGGPIGGLVGAAVGAAGDAAVSGSLMGMRNALANRQARAMRATILSRSPLAQSRAPVSLPGPNPILSALINGQITIPQILGFGAIPARADQQQ